MTVMLETGCAATEPDCLNIRESIIRNNPAETTVKSHYLHLGKGTAISAHDKV